MYPVKSMLFISCTGKGQLLSNTLMVSINTVVDFFNTCDLTDALEWLGKRSYNLPGIIFLEPVEGNKENNQLLKSLLGITSSNNITVVTFSSFTGQPVSF